VLKSCKGSSPHFCKVHPHALKAFQKPIDNPYHFSKAFRESHFSKMAREFQYIHQPKGKGELKSCEGLQNKFSQ